MWGDPHFQTIDGMFYTFNGFGEYILLQSEAKNFTVQVRLAHVDETNMDQMATVISAVVVVQGTVQPVQVEQQSGGGIVMYVDGTSTELPAEEESLIVTEDTTYDSFTDFTASDPDFSSTEYISIRHSASEELVIASSSGASVMVSGSSAALHLAVEVNDAFINSTEGLLGYFNGDPSDDFYSPNGTVVSNTSTESELYTYGKLCKSLCFFFSLSLSLCVSLCLCSLTNMGRRPAICAYWADCAPGACIIMTATYLYSDLMEQSYSTEPPGRVVVQSSPRV